MLRLRHGHWKLLKLQVRLPRRPRQLQPCNPGTIRGSTPGLNRAKASDCAIAQPISSS